MKKLLLGTVGALALGIAPAQAAHFNGWYVSLEGGANWVDEWNHGQQTTNGAGVITDTDTATSSFDTGWAVSGSVGYAFRNWRLEVEGGYRSNDQDSLVQFDPGPTLITKSGELTHWSVMGNVLYDIPLWSRWSVTLGAGAGAALSDFNYAPGRSDDEWNLAWQGIGGINYAIGRRTDLYVSYRYFRVVDPEFSFATTTPAAINGDDFVNHTVTLGLRFDLSPDEVPEPPPPPAVAPAPPPAPPAVKHFVIFFGFNKCNITSEADGVLSQAASAAKSTRFGVDLDRRSHRYGRQAALQPETLGVPRQCREDESCRQRHCRKGRSRPPAAARRS